MPATAGGSTSGSSTSVTSERRGRGSGASRSGRPSACRRAGSARCAISVRLQRDDQRVDRDRVVSRRAAGPAGSSRKIATIGRSRNDERERGRERRATTANGLLTAAPKPASRSSRLAVRAEQVGDELARGLAGCSSPSRRRSRSGRSAATRLGSGIAISRDDAGARRRSRRRSRRRPRRARPCRRPPSRPAPG